MVFRSWVLGFPLLFCLLFLSLCSLCGLWLIHYKPDQRERHDSAEQDKRTGDLITGEAHFYFVILTCLPVFQILLTEALASLPVLKIV